MREIDRIIYDIDTEVYLIFRYMEQGWTDFCEQGISRIERLTDSGQIIGWNDPAWQKCLSRTCYRMEMLGYALEGL